jgi:hypothetical protein
MALDKSGHEFVAEELQRPSGQVDDSSAIGPQFVGLPVAPLEVGAVAHGVLRARRRSASSIRHPAQCA